jgi:hypothetical protein
LLISATSWTNYSGLLRTKPHPGCGITVRGLPGFFIDPDSILGDPDRRINAGEKVNHISLSGMILKHPDTLPILFRCRQSLLGWTMKDLPGSNVVSSVATDYPATRGEFSLSLVLEPQNVPLVKCPVGGTFPIGQESIRT